MKKSSIRAASIGLAAVLATAACSSTASKTETANAAPQAMGANTAAAELRATLQAGLGAHVLLVAEATGALMSGRTSEVAGPRAALLGANADEIAAGIGGPYGAKKQAEVRALWVKHVPYLLDYARGLKEGNGRLRDSSVGALMSYTQEFGAAIEALPAEGLTQELVAGLIRDHILTIKSLIDAQHARGPVEVIGEQLKSLNQASSVAATVAPAVATQNGLEGDAASRASDQRSAILGALQEHVALLTMTTNGMLDGRSEEAAAAREVLVGRNAVAFATVFVTYGAPVQKSILDLWRKHSGYVLDYKSAVRGGNRGAAAEASANLDASSLDIATELHNIIPTLPAKSVESLLTTHSEAVIDSIDAQAAGRFEVAAAALTVAIDALDDLAALLADAVVGA